MAAIGEKRAESLIQEATKAGLTEAEIEKIITDLGRSPKYAYNMSEKDATSFLNRVEALKALKRRGLATMRQVDYIMDLLDRRPNGEGGFMTGPTTRAEVEKMKFADASAYIDSLKGSY